MTSADTIISPSTTSTIIGDKSKTSTNEQHFIQYVNKIEKKIKSHREIRQIRMFSAILILMTTFLICRLPTWLFLLYKLHYTATSNLSWMLNYCFGLLSMANCVLNPLLYTFLTETIQISMNCVNRFRKQLRNCCGINNSSN